jgi:hypothetical protein
MVAALALAQLSNLMGCLTTYGIGSAPPYFGAGYVPQVSNRGLRSVEPCSTLVVRMHATPVVLLRHVYFGAGYVPQVSNGDLRSTLV